ncbi:hypothetical protein C8J57DRAFT_1293846 [Mycena rebaudengoi]|nr:hypothetical protein C8J57DRAFT_1293846 [Mycena rebaudengoi]
MAKSTRSKGIYAATEAARLNRLNQKLSSVASKGDLLVDAEQMEEGEDDLPAEGADNDDAEMQVDADGTQKRISTHGPRGSRREEWRTSKGLAARPSPAGMNRQGGVAARRKAGRSKRRR